jgi:hypothetical protein
MNTRNLMRILAVLTALATMALPDPAAALVIGPPAAPAWATNAHLRLGWVFDTPTNPGASSPLAGWTTAPAGTPVWDYDAGRVAFTYPAQWHTALNNGTNDHQMQYFWFSFVYDFSATPPGNPSLYSSVVAQPSNGNQGFSFVDEWFTGAGAPTTNHEQAVYGRWTAQLQMWPSPDTVEIFLGTAPALGIHVREVYLIGTTYECINDTVCTDVDPCLGTEFCDLTGVYGPHHTCQYDPATTTSCDSSGDTQCRKNLCNPDTLDCEMTDLEAGAVCNDGNLCTYTDVCDGAGTCGGTAYFCIPGQCHASNSCDGGGGCTPIYKAPGTACDDGLDFTSGDVCNLGTCAGIEDGSCGNPVQIGSSPWSHATTTVARPSHVSLYGTGCGDETEGLGQGDVIYEMELEAGQTVTVTVDPAAGVDVAVAVIEECADDEACVEWADESGAGEEEQVVVTAGEAGTYYVVVEGKNDPGEHTLTVQAGSDVDVDVDTDADSDSDGDSDADSDSDSDSDSDADADGDVDGDADGDDDDDGGGDGDSGSCGCLAVGRADGPRGLLGLLHRLAGAGVES